jgi:hypothetical protein
MRVFLERAAVVLSLLIAAAWISGCVIHAHHVDADDADKPAKTHKAKPPKAHKAKPPKAKPPKPEPTEQEPVDREHNPPQPPPPSHQL